MAWAVRQKVGNATGKAILLMISNYADDRGECFPSQERLAEECECSVATVARWLLSFEAMGFLKRSKRYGDSGYRRSDVLIIDISQPVTELPSIKLDNSVSKLTHQSDGTYTINEPTKSLPNRVGEFDEFWSLYPNKVGKRLAKEKFLSALKRSSFQEIMDGLKKYVAKKDDRFWCNPATWLNQDRWADQPATKGSAPPQQIDWDKRLSYYHEKGTWAPAWGPRPGEIGCKAPDSGKLSMGTSPPRSTITTSAFPG